MQRTIDAQEGTRPITVAGRPATEVTLGGVRVVVESGPDVDLSATLSSTSLRIGTARTNDLVLTDPGASREHAMLTLTRDGVLLEDLGSTNGTWLAGARLRAAVVPDGSRITIGTSILRIQHAPSKLVVFPAEDAAFMGMLGGSKAMREVFALVRQLAKTDLPVAITGETGTGKELVAGALHRSGPRAGRPFLVLDCGAVVEDLLRSEIFGHEKGAFTGADHVRKGILEECDGGTVLLDEVGELKPSVQPQLLRALETRTVSRIGSTRPIPVDFRIVSATNRALARLVSSGGFRQDLYYRLSCVTIRLPPLRERVEDIGPLAHSFVAECATRQGLPAPSLTPQAVTTLERHPWPGNVRELKNVAEALCVLSGGTPIEASNVASLLAAAPAAPPAAGLAAGPAGSLDGLERDAIARALAASGGNKKVAAKQLGIALSTLYEKLKRLGIAS